MSNNCRACTEPNSANRELLGASQPTCSGVAPRPPVLSEMARRKMASNTSVASFWRTNTRHRESRAVLTCRTGRLTATKVISNVGVRTLLLINNFCGPNDCDMRRREFSRGVRGGQRRRTGRGERGRIGKGKRGRMWKGRRGRRGYVAGIPFSQ